MTAPLTNCPACAAGLVRFDPQTGEERCGGCGANIIRPSPSDTLRGVEPHLIVSDGVEPPRKISPETKAALKARNLPPTVLGGQGRDAEEVTSDAVAWGYFAGLGLAFVVGVLAHAAWVAR